MKTFPANIVVLCVAALILSVTAYEIPPEMKEIIDAAHTGCKEESGVDEGVLADAMKGIVADDMKLKCFTKCVLMRLQAMKDDGTLDLDLIEASMPEELKNRGAIDTLKKCMVQPGEDLCVKAFDILACTKRENPKLAEFFH